MSAKLIYALGDESRENWNILETTLFVIQSEAKNLENIKEDVHVDALEILPPFGRLNDTLCNRYIITNIFCS